MPRLQVHREKQFSVVKDGLQNVRSAEKKKDGKRTWNHGIQVKHSRETEKAKKNGKRTAKSDDRKKRGGGWKMNDRNQTEAILNVEI